jgi:hypothetical protein
MNGGWIQIGGPIARFAQFKFIETNQFNSALQQVRYPPTRIAYAAPTAISNLYMLPGAIYSDPDFSWVYEIGPAGTTFVNGNALGPEYNGTLWIGSARSNQQVGGNGGSLYRFNMTQDRLHVDVSADPRLADRVADNLFTPNKFDGTESESLRIGTGFGITPGHRAGTRRQSLRRLQHRQLHLQDQPQPTGQVQEPRRRSEVNPTRTLQAALLAAALAAPASAQIIINGSFESGFTGWTRLEQTGSNGTFALQSGAVSPVNAFAVPAPPAGLQRRHDRFHRRRRTRPLPGLHRSRSAPSPRQTSRSPTTSTTTTLHISTPAISTGASPATPAASTSTSRLASTS